jgi:hypothetical protein
MKTSIMNPLTAIVVVFTLFSPAVIAADQAQLEWKWTPGEVHRYTMTQDMDMTMEMGNLPEQAGAAGFGPNMKTTQHQVFTLKEEVKELSPEGTATVEQTIESMQFDMDVPGMGKMSYDSENPDQSAHPMAPMAQPMTKLVGKSFTLVRDKTGKILEMRGMQELMDDMMAGFGNDPVSSQIKNQFSEMFKDENFESFNQCSFEALPAEAVGPGSSWGCTTSQPIPMLGQMQRDSTYTLEGYETVDGMECANIAFNFKGDQEPSNLSSGSNPMAQFMEFKSMSLEGSGNMLFAKEEGHLVKQTSKTTMDMEMEMKMPAGFPAPGQEQPGASAKPMTMKQKMEMVTVLERVE